MPWTPRRSLMAIDTRTGGDWIRAAGSSACDAQAAPHDPERHGRSAGQALRKFELQALCVALELQWRLHAKQLYPLYAARQDRPQRFQSRLRRRRAPEREGKQHVALPRVADVVAGEGARLVLREHT